VDGQERRCLALLILNTSSPAGCCSTHYRPSASRGARSSSSVLALHCGLREGELLGLKWDDIDPIGATATLHVKHTLSQTRTGHIFEKPKNGKGRSIKCSQKATDALGRHRSRQNQERSAAGPLWKDNDLVFPTLTGTTKSGTNLLGRHF
jgi:integrase